MNLYYEASDGTIIDLMGSSVYAQNPEALTNNNWKYSTISSVNGLGRLKRVYKDSEEQSLTLSIMADSDEKFNEIMDRLHKVFDKDVRRLTPGRLWWNDCYKEAFAISTSNNEFEEYFQSVEHVVTFLSVKPYWTREKKFQFYDLSQSSAALDYDESALDYNDFDYDIEELIEVVDNDCVDRADFELRFYGPCQNPSVTISNHIYELYTDLDTGEYATINSRTKKIRKFDIYGNEENIFADRNKESYIFEKIPAGICYISRSKELKIDITLFDERGEPTWI